MNNFDLYSAINGIDKDIIEEAGTVHKTKKRNYFWGAVAAAFVLLIAVSAFNLFPNKPIITTPNTTTTSENKVNNDTVIIYPFKSTIDPNVDSYGDDGLPYVDLMVGNKVYYHQIDLSDYDKYNLPKKLTSENFGEYIGCITEITDENRSIAETFELYSQEPTLNNAKAYYYAPLNCKAVIIVKNETNCSLFIASEVKHTGSSYYKELFELFNVRDNTDISEISYQIWCGEYDETNTAILENGEITDENTIKQIYDILLSSYISENDEKIIDPCSAVLYLHTTDGLVICDNGSMAYYPFKGNGEIAGRGALTQSENEILKAALNIE